MPRMEIQIEGTRKVRAHPAPLSRVLEVPESIPLRWRRSTRHAERRAVYRHDHRGADHPRGGYGADSVKLFQLCAMTRSRNTATRRWRNDREMDVGGKAELTFRDREVHRCQREIPAVAILSECGCGCDAGEGSAGMGSKASIIERCTVSSEPRSGVLIADRGVYLPSATCGPSRTHAMAEEFEASRRRLLPEVAGLHICGARRTAGIAGRRPGAVRVEEAGS